MSGSKQSDSGLEQQNRGLSDNAVPVRQNPASTSGRARSDLAALPGGDLPDPRRLPDHLRRGANSRARCPSHQTPERNFLVTARGGRHQVNLAARPKGCLGLRLVSRLGGQRSD